MRHRVTGRTLGRSMGHRTALRRTLVTNLFRHGRIRTETKDKAIRRQTKLITLAKHGWQPKSQRLSSRSASGRRASERSADRQEAVR
jgi:ribosomal protein L17